MKINSKKDESCECFCHTTKRDAPLTKSTIHHLLNPTPFFSCLHSYPHILVFLAVQLHAESSSSPKGQSSAPKRPGRGAQQKWRCWVPSEGCESPFGRHVRGVRRHLYVPLFCLRRHSDCQYVTSRSPLFLPFAQCVGPEILPGHLQKKLRAYQPLTRHRQSDTINPTGPPALDRLLFISLGFGFSLAVTAWAFYRISGGLFNPAVTLGMV